MLRLLFFPLLRGGHSVFWYYRSFGISVFHCFILFFFSSFFFLLFLYFLSSFLFVSFLSLLLCSFSSFFFWLKTRRGLVVSFLLYLHVDFALHQVYCRLLPLLPTSCLTLLGLSRLSHRPTTRIATTCYTGPTVAGRPLVFLVSYSTTADIILCRYSFVSFPFSFSSTNAAYQRRPSLIYEVWVGLWSRWVAVCFE